MFGDIEKLKLLSIAEGESVRQGLYTDRFSHALVYKLSGESVYHFGGKRLELRAGDVLYIPKGSSYTVHRTSQQESRYVLINFEGTPGRNEPAVFSLDGFGDAGLVQTGLARMWLFGDRVERYKCSSVFYNMLFFLAGKERLRHDDAAGLALLRPAMETLETRLFDSNLRAGELHRLCGVSDTYFRRLFKANYGVTPQEYITNKRLAQAAALICGGDFGSVGQVAQSVGYSDPLYFSRVFARRYGSSPTQYLHK